MVKVSGFQYNAQIGGGHVAALACPFVVDRDHVCAEVGDDLGHRHELTGLVLQLNAQGLLSAGAEESALDDAVEDRHVDVAARHDADDLFSLNRQLTEHDSRQRRRTGTLGDHLLALDQR